MPIPDKFNEAGLLDPGTYDATFKEIYASILVTGHDHSEKWDSSWRAWLVGKLEILVQQLWDVGINDIFINGSFVEDKDHPNDIDGYFDPGLSMYDKNDIIKFQSIVSQLNDLDQYKIWNWDPLSRKPYRGYPKAQLPMWHFYRIELYPHLNQGTGIKDKNGFDLTFPSAFRQSRNNFQPKGIVRVIS